MIRLFVSLNLPEEVKDKLIEIRNSVVPVQNLRWESKEKLHLTLKFIGEVDNFKLDSIKDELRFIEDYPAIKCEIFKFDFFFRNKIPAILWAGLKTDEIIFSLVDELNNRLKNLSIPLEDKKFKSHLTLMRIKKNPGNNFVNSFKNFTFEPIIFKANSVSLIKSELNSSGSKYFEIKNYKLKQLEK